MQDGSVSPIRAFFRNWWVRLILIADFLVILVIVILSVNKSTKTAVIDFMITPLDATISINGKDTYKNGGEAYFLTPGTYEIQISHPELDIKSFTIELEANHNTTITTFLSRGGNFEFYELRDNFSSFEVLSNIASSANNQTTDHDTSAEAFVADFQKNYDLYYTKLPIEYRDSADQSPTSNKNITIRASYDCEFVLCLQALVVGTKDKEFVNSLLKDKGFNLEDLHIEYKFY